MGAGGREASSFGSKETKIAGQGQCGGQPLPGLPGPALVPRVLAEAETMAAPDYLAGAKACLAWLAWQDRRRDEVIRLSAEIAELMTATVDLASYHGPVHLWPALAAHLDAGDLAGAAAAARRFAPGLPGDLAEAVRAGAAAWDQGRAGPARDRLAAALALARDLRFF